MMNNKTLAMLVRLYATGSHQDVVQFLHGLSKDTLASTLTDLLTQYINDRNSSTLREWLTLTVAGYTPIEEKLGYNGYRMAGIGAKKEYCEVKPVNVYRKEDGAWSRKLNGGGNFSDYTPERLKKDLSQNLWMLTSGFAEGKLLYVLRFPFFCLREHLEQVLKRQFGGTRRPRGQYLRKASFSYRNFSNCPQLEVKFVADDLFAYHTALTQEFYHFLEARLQDV